MPTLNPVFPNGRVGIGTDFLIFGAVLELHPVTFVIPQAATSEAVVLIKALLLSLFMSFLPCKQVAPAYKKSLIRRIPIPARFRIHYRVITQQ
jgi:hypothetical protein